MSGIVLDVGRLVKRDGEPDENVHIECVALDHDEAVSLLGTILRAREAGRADFNCDISDAIASAAQVNADEILAQLDDEDEDEHASPYDFAALAYSGSARRVVLEALGAAREKAFPCDYDAIDELVDAVEGSTRS